MTTHSTALVAALEALNNLPEKASEDTRAKALIRVDVAHRELLANSTEADREAFAPVLDAMRGMPDVREMVACNARYTVRRRPNMLGGRGPFLEVFRHDEVQFNPRRYIRNGLISFVIGLALSLAMIAADPSFPLGYVLLAVVTLATIVGTGFAVAEGKDDAENRAEKSVAEIYLSTVSNRYGIDLDAIGVDHPDLAQWLLDFDNLPSICPAHIEADMKRRLKAMADSPLAASHVEERLYELRNGVERQLPATPSIPKQAASTLRRKMRS